MRFLRILSVLGAIVASIATACATIQTQRVPYAIGEQKFMGFLAFDDALAGKRPAILIVHDWNSIDAYEESRAQQLAALGYVAFCVDIYGDGVRPKNAAESGAQAGKYRGNRSLFRERLKAGLDLLAAHPRVDASKIAAIGYCFGGTGVLEMARAGMKVRGVVSFHGGLETPTPDDIKSVPVKASVLVCHGVIDPFVSPKSIVDFQKEMNDAKVDYQFVAYSGAVHSFTEPAAGSNVASGAAYDAAADRRSWIAMRAFFDEIFAK